MRLAFPIISLTYDVTSKDIEKAKKKQACMNTSSKPIDEKLWYGKVFTQVNKTSKIE